MQSGKSLRWKALFAVCLVISLLTLFFLLQLINRQHQALHDVVALEQNSQLMQMELLRNQVGESYQKRLESFVTIRKSFMAAFADGNREQLQSLAEPLFRVLKKENPYFETLFFVDPANRTFLRVTKPEFYGDDLTTLSPLVAEANRTRKPLAGFEIVRKGFHYRLVCPVEVAGEYIGLVGFGIDADFFIEQLQQISHSHEQEHHYTGELPETGIVYYFPRSELEKVEFSDKEYLRFGDAAVLTRNSPHFSELLQENSIDPFVVPDVIQVTLHGVPHALIQGAVFEDYRGQQVAGTLALVNVEPQVAGARQVIVQSIVIALALLTIAIFVLHFSFTVLFHKIERLNASLALANSELEQRVEERTGALQQSEENLRITLDSIGEAMIAADTEGRVMRMNPVAEQLTGWSFSEARGRKFEEVFRAIDLESRRPLENVIEKVLSATESRLFESEILLISRNGKEYLVAESGALIRDSAGKTSGTVIIFRDMTKEQALQNQLLQSQKMEAVGLLAGGVAHDFNNMLGGIMSASELLGRRLPDDIKAKTYIDMIRDSAKRAADLTENLLSFARKRPISSAPVDVHTVLRDTVKLLLNTIDRRVHVAIDLAAEGSVVVGDQGQLQNAFLNLGINASQSMAEGGQLSIATRVVELNSTYCQASNFDLQAGLFLEVEVRDTGCGIEQDHLQHIFEPFFTTRANSKGTGLGLASVLGTVQQHSGAIGVYSEPGTGTVFHILLPLVDEVAQSLPEPEPLVTGQGRILIVDDEALMRATSGALLEDLGYDILLAENGRHGLELFKQNRSDIDLVLLDMIMPEMNGRDCFREIRRIDPAAKIVLSSGFIQSHDLDDMRDNGLLGFISKPYNFTELSRVVAMALQGKRIHKPV